MVGWLALPLTSLSVTQGSFPTLARPGCVGKIHTQQKKEGTACSSLYLDSVKPLDEAVFPERQRERAEVRDKCGRHENIAQQVVVDSLEIGGRFRPSLFLAAQTADQLLGTIQLLRAQVDLQPTVTHMTQL